MEDCDVHADVDVRDPDEKSIMTYVAQFLQYSKDLPLAEDDVQVGIPALVWRFMLLFCSSLLLCEGTSDCAEASASSFA